MTVIEYENAGLGWLTLEDQSGNRRRYSNRLPVLQPSRADVICSERGFEVQLTSATLPDEIIVDISENVWITYGMASSAHFGSYKYFAQ